MGTQGLPERACIQRGSAVFVSGLGAITTVLAATHIIAPDEPLFGALFAAITTVFGLSLVYGGYRLRYRSDIDSQHHPKVAMWTFAGMVLVGVVLGIMILYQVAEGAEIEDPLFFIGGTVAVGGVGGFLIGTNNAQRASREQELQLQNNRLEEFASVVSHDLRNPLNVAQGRLEMAQSEHESEHLDCATQACDRMERLIEDLLTLAREGAKVQKTETVDIGVLAEKCWETVETPEADIRVEMEQSEQADRSRLRQLLENLYRNAIEHGGESVTVTVGELDDGFYVEDDGSGIPSDQRESVFDTGYSTADDGTGFGLSIVKQVVEAHGWDIGVTEGADGGARFEITGIKSRR